MTNESLIFDLRCAGEKIGSLADYRQWLRDQNKYRRKAGWLEQ